MSRFNKSIFIFLIGIRATTCDLAQAREYAGPYRPYSVEIKEFQDDLSGYKEGDFATMNFDDIRLKVAYRDLFGSTNSGEFQSERPEMIAALSDIRRRGDEVTPMLLKLMNENQETGFEASVLASVAAVGTISLDPYLGYARTVLRERTQSMSAVLAACAASLLSKHGTKEDAELMKWVMETRPWVADSITRKLDSLNRRLSQPTPESRPPKSMRLPSDDPAHGGSRHVKQKNQTTTVVKDQESTRWIKLALVILVAGGLAMLAIRKCFNPK